MKRTKQVTVYCPDTPEALSRMASALWGNQVNIRSCTADLTEGVVRIRLNVDRPALARRLIHQHGWDTEHGKWPLPFAS